MAGAILVSLLYSRFAAATEIVTELTLDSLPPPPSLSLNGTLINDKSFDLALLNLTVDRILVWQTSRSCLLLPGYPSFFPTSLCHYLCVHSSPSFFQTCRSPYLLLPGYSSFFPTSLCHHLYLHGFRLPSQAPSVFITFFLSTLYCLRFIVISPDLEREASSKNRQ